MSLPTPYYDCDGITIYHGDCREILPHLPKVDLVLTDPPYGVGIDYGAYKDDPEAYWGWFLPVIDLMRAVGSGTVFTHRQEAIRYITNWSHLCCWNKVMNFTYAIHGWLAHWEPIFVFDTQPSIVMKEGSKPARNDVYTCHTTKNNTGHPCPKPLSLMTQLIQTFPSQRVLDPFCGSGTTLRAAKDLGRKAIGIEIEEKYCEIAVKRLGQGVLPF